MNAYVRFQTQLRCQATGRPLGIFGAAGRIEDSPHVAPATRDLLRESLVWFNGNLVVPSLGGRGWRCIFWFRSEAQELIERIWDLVAIIHEEGIHIRKIWTTRPGQIIYADEHQIGAVPGKHRSNNFALRV